MVAAAYDPGAALIYRPDTPHPPLTPTSQETARNPSSSKIGAAAYTNTLNNFGCKDRVTNYPEAGCAAWTPGSSTVDMMVAAWNNDLQAYDCSQVDPRFRRGTCCSDPFVLSTLSKVCKRLERTLQRNRWIRDQTICCSEVLPYSPSTPNSTSNQPANGNHPVKLSNFPTPSDNLTCNSSTCYKSQWYFSSRVQLPSPTLSATLAVKTGSRITRKLAVQHRRLVMVAAWNNNIHAYDCSQVDPRFRRGTCCSDPSNLDYQISVDLWKQDCREIDGSEIKP
ncbi:hypothetical protein MJO29_017023 [Puccinia striiformis f. sp. tritici]|nr:hypothetical protein MJO29_017023 [Puccinia striiformis f. sp. tritici]